MTYKECIAAANAEYARAECNEGILRPIDEQIIVGRLVENLKTATPSYPIRPNTGGPTAPPTGDVEPARWAERKVA